MEPGPFAPVRCIERSRDEASEGHAALEAAFGGIFGKAIFGPSKIVSFRRTCRQRRFADFARRFPTIADVPDPGTEIARGEPVMTIFARGQHRAANAANGFSVGSMRGPGGSEALEIGDQVVELLLGQPARPVTTSGLWAPASAVGEVLRAAVVEVRVLVVDAAERGGIVALVDVVAFFEPDVWILPSVSSGPPWQVLQAALAERKTASPRWRPRRQRRRRPSR